MSILAQKRKLYNNRYNHRRKAEKEMKKLMAMCLALLLAAGTVVAEGMVYTTTSVTDSANTQNMFSKF